ncbi:MAG: alpha/beta hydrolase, partial [Anaerolineales bacterium]|nr:alpha/beta hydrolase [Anaerolineales bacterium]
MQEIGKLLLYTLVGYLALCFVVFIFQRKLLYFPYQNRFSEASAHNEGLRHWPSYDNFRGFINRKDPIDAEGTVIVFHGNAGTAFHRSFYAQALTRHNLRVILAEYPGYGGREGRPNEQVLVADALETITLAYQEFGEPLFVWGESLGCGVVSSSIPQTEIPIEGVVLFLPWDTLPDLAQTHYWYFPTRWLVLDKFNNIENLKGYEGRIAVLLAENDEVVPVKHGKNLYVSLTTGKKLWVFENSRHNEVPVAPQLSWW